MRSQVQCSVFSPLCLTYSQHRLSVEAMESQAKSWAAMNISILSSSPKCFCQVLSWPLHSEYHCCLQSSYNLNRKLQLTPGINGSIFSPSQLYSKLLHCNPSGTYLVIAVHKSLSKNRSAGTLVWPSYWPCCHSVCIYVWLRRPGFLPSMQRQSWVPGDLLWPSPAPAVASIWRTSQWKAASLAVPLFLSIL